MELRDNGSSGLDGNLKTITEAALEHVLLACPGTRVEHRDGKRVAVIPFYNFDSDEAGVFEKEIVPGPQQTPMGILPVFDVRSGPVANPDGDVRETPLGKFYRIVGYSPQPNKDRQK